MEIKLGCGCGQNYEFNVEPVNGLIPSKVACPGCGADGTAAANQILAQHFPNHAPPVPVALRVEPAAAVPTPAGAGALRVSLPQSAPAPMTAIAEPISPGSRPAGIKAALKAKKSADFSLGMGVVGAVLGAALGAGLMFGFYAWAHFRFPLMGTIVGALTCFGARTLGKGTESTLGVIAGAIALVATGGTLYLMFGEIAGLFIISMVVSVSFAYRIAG